MSKRNDELLKAAADAFEDGRSPFEHEWLSEHDVTSNECIELSNQIGMILRGYAASPQTTRLIILACSTAEEAGLDPVFLEAELRKQDLLKRLGR